MAIKIAAWNIECRLSGWAEGRRGSVGHILENIRKLNADLLILPETYMDEQANGVDNCLKELGYSIHSVAYGDYSREDEPFFNGLVHMYVLSRLPVTKVEYIRPGDVRNLIVCHVVDPETKKEVRVLATHLDERSEHQRMLQVAELVHIINESRLPTVVLGDFNAMWRKGRAQLIGSKSAKFLAQRVPHEILRGTALQVVEMAAGTALSMLTASTALRDADPKYRPTATPKRQGSLYFPSIRLVQLDHILTTPHIKAENFKIGKDSGADHRPISATLVVK